MQLLWGVYETTPNHGTPSGVVSASADVKFSCGNWLRFFIAKKTKNTYAFPITSSWVRSEEISSLCFLVYFFFKEMTCPARTWPSVTNTIFGRGLYISVYKYGRHLRDTLLFQTFIAVSLASSNTVLPLTVVDQTVRSFMSLHSATGCLGCIPFRWPWLNARICREFEFRRHTFVWLIWNNIIFTWNLKMCWIQLKQVQCVTWNYREHTGTQDRETMSGKQQINKKKILYAFLLLLLLMFVKG